MTLRRQVVGTTPEGEEILRIQAENASGLEVSFLSFGGIIQRVALPDRSRTPRVISLGFGDPLRYLQPHPNFGVTVGRYANRIAGARFGLGGREYSLEANDGRNTLHGGNSGWAKRNWRAEMVGEGEDAGVTFRLSSPEGDGGFPGAISAEVTYLVSETGELSMTWRAEADESGTRNSRAAFPTPVSITNHAYWNLSGDPTRTVLDHEVMLPGAAVLPVDEESIPTGEIADVAQFAGGRYDLRDGARLSDRVRGTGDGYDICYLVPGAEITTGAGAESPQSGPGGLPLAARAACEETGITLELSTDLPGVQFYTGNKLAGRDEARSDSLPQYAGFCFEPQYFPDAPNHENFPTPLVEPGKPLEHRAVFRLSVG
jgi:aldose 1-epimerase